ncbi:MAG: TetR/AcrR family transcriptional regulator [Gammaproteobacteria bacterium]
MNAERGTDKHTKHGDILAAAQKVFLREGYDLASMEAIACEAEVSKQTVYNHFGGKEELFRGFVQARCEAISSALDRDFLDAGDGPERVLTAFARNILDVMLSRETMHLKRLLQSEGRRHPKLAKIFYRLGPDRTASRLADYLAEQRGKGRLTVQDPRIAAEQFVSMLTGHLRMRHLIGLAKPPTRAEREQYIANAVQLFLDGARPR